jgi:hypothetical protein
VSPVRLTTIAVTRFVIEGESYRKRTAPGSLPTPKNSQKATT